MAQLRVFSKTMGNNQAQPQTPTGFWVLRIASYSVLISRRSVWAITALLLGIVALVGAAFASGTASLDPLAAFAALSGHGSKQTLFIVRELRLPRIAAALLTGAALGMAGCLMQTLSRNRLATPDIIGIDNGATAFAVASIVAVSTGLLPSALALIGAITAAALALGLSGGAGSHGYRFIVVGLGIGAMFGAATSLMLARAPLHEANAAYPWTIGSLNGHSSAAIRWLGIGLIVCTPLALVLGRTLNVLRLPPHVAHSLGVKVHLVRLGVLGVVALCTGMAVAVAGPVGMIALAAPELARQLAGSRNVPIFSAGLAGAALMLLSDTLGRTIVAPIEIPVGIVTAIVGGPYLLWLLLRTPHRRMV